MPSVVVVDRCQHNVHEDVHIHNNVDKEEHCEPVVLVVCRHPTTRSRSPHSVLPLHAIAGV